MKKFLLPSNIKFLYSKSPSKILIVVPKNISNLYNTIKEEISECEIIFVEDNKEKIFQKLQV